MDIKKLFKKLIHDRPDLFYIGDDYYLAIKNCRWYIAMPAGDSVLVHDLRWVTTKSFNFDFIHDSTTLIYGEWKEQFYDDEVEAEQIILASAIHYNEMYFQVVKERYNKQVEQTLNNLD